LSAACAFGAFLLSGCGGKAELVEFNERIFRPFDKLVRATKACFAAGGAVAAGKDLPGGTDSLAEFRSRYDRLQEAVAEARAAAGALEVPPAAGARQYYDNFQHLLKVSDENLADLRPTRNASNKEALAGRQRLHDLLDRASLRTTRAWDRMVAAQQAFARENEIKLK
jgi:hypothetical protein